MRAANFLETRAGQLHGTRERVKSQMGRKKNENLGRLGERSAPGTQIEFEFNYSEPFRRKYKNKKMKR